MNHHSTTSWRTGLGIGAGVLAMLFSSALVAAPAQALAASPTVKCLTGTGTSPNRFHHVNDTSPVTTAMKARVQRELDEQARATGSSRSSTAPLPATIRVPVHIHVIRGTHQGDRKVTRTAARRLFYNLRGAYQGNQNAEMAPTGVIFELENITVDRNDKWFHARPMSTSDKQMRHRLHRGKARTLNVYLNNAESQGGALLGVARFPWQYAAHPRLDGVMVNVNSLNGGSATDYNKGDTLVHETGHWLGLFHTFEGGCDKPGDQVSDTAPEAGPSFTCPLSRDTCPTYLPATWTQGDPLPEPVADPVTNFMDYSFDKCMNNLTPGQRDRIFTSFMRYRAGR